MSPEVEQDEGEYEELLRKAYMGYDYKDEDESELEGRTEVNVAELNKRNGHIYQAES